MSTTTADHTARRLRTVGTIAASLGVPVHRVQYIIRARGIVEAARAGTLRLFDRRAEELVADALRPRLGARLVEEARK